MTPLRQAISRSLIVCFREDVGQLDAIEVMEIAEKTIPHDPHRVILTGHSMGGHGTWHVGLTFPDPELKLDEASGHWRFGEIDWSEFKRVLAGDGPCNRQRMGVATKAHVDGAWVREAALAHARKRAERTAAARIAAE